MKNAVLTMASLGIIGLLVVLAPDIRRYLRMVTM